MNIIEFFKQTDKSSIVIVVMFILLLTLFYAKKSSKYIKDLVRQAVIEAERQFNSGEGQKKLEFAINIIRPKLPFLLRIFITKSVLVTLIEYTLNKIADTFETNIKVDIIGNEHKVEKINLNINKDSVEISSKNIEKIEVPDNKAEIYASVKAKTDWRNKPETSIEVGIKKKL